MTVVEVLLQADTATILATLGVAFAVLKLINVMKAPYIPRVWVPLQPGEWCATNFLTAT